MQKKDECVNCISTKNNWKMVENIVLHSRHIISSIPWIWNFTAGKMSCVNATNTIRSPRFAHQRENHNCLQITYLIDCYDRITNVRIIVPRDKWTRCPIYRVYFILLVNRETPWLASQRTQESHNSESYNYSSKMNDIFIPSYIREKGCAIIPVKITRYWK